MAIDVVVDRFNFFLIFLCQDVHNKVRVSVIRRGRHTVLILFAQGNDVDVWLVSFPLVLTIGI